MYPGGTNILGHIIYGDVGWTKDGHLTAITQISAGDSTLVIRWLISQNNAHERGSFGIFSNRFRGITLLTKSWWLDISQFKSARRTSEEEM